MPALIRLARTVTFAVAAVVFLTMHAARAQADDPDDIEAEFQKPTAVEAERLRAVLATPMPRGASAGSLRRHFIAQELAAKKLGDRAQVEAVLRLAVSQLPDARFRRNLARPLLENGQTEEGNALMRQAIAAADAYRSALFLAQSACDLVDQNDSAAARTVIAEVTKKLKSLDAGEVDARGRMTMFRASSENAKCLSALEERSGRAKQAIDAAMAAGRDLRQAASLAEGEQKTTIEKAVARSLNRLLRANLAAGRLQDAEAVLADYRRYASETRLPANFLFKLYEVAAELRFAQREFPLAEALARKADSVLAALGYDASNPDRNKAAMDISLSLVGQHKWSEALQVAERLDASVLPEPTRKVQIGHAFERGLVYLGNRRFADAALLLGIASKGRRERLGATHLATIEAMGLEGVARWRSGTPGDKNASFRLLKDAANAYLAPTNADFLENIGLHKELRKIIFAAYLEAVSSIPGEDAVQALGVADWVRGGVVQEALGDAAARAAASTPALADVVRKEQDAKNEVAGLRRYLSGAAGGAASPLPGISAQMRERIAVLEGERAKLQAEIKAKFPDYDRLVRPSPPSVADIARQLEPQQALVMLLPTADAVYAWAVASDRPAGFVRIALPEAQLNEMVVGLRRQLDFANGASVGKTYDSAKAFALYDKLLAPLASVWRGKTQLVVAAGGALSQLPFAVLHTHPAGGFNASAPWLIKDASITQVPSLSAWLAIKSIAKTQPAPQAFAGWGDPTFGPQAAVAATRIAQSRSVVLIRASTLADLDRPEKTTSAPSALKYAEIPALPETREELLAIASTLKGDPAVDLFLGAKATRESVLAASKSGQLATKRVIAFATHGLMAGDLPDLNQPALAMAATGTEAQNPLAPLLTLEDVLTLKLNADWVVLSACNTAAADGRAEEALSGLARGFFYAGSRSLLVTHWAVESESAKELTTNTFAHYVANPSAPKAESLRQAMLKVMAMSQFSHPAYWAPYALVGDGGR